MKRWLTFILLLITLSGTVSPCCLVDECEEEEKITGQKENRQEPAGSCSPFFACASCPGFTDISKQLHLVQPPGQDLVHEDAVFIIDLSTYSSFFWQPPRAC